VKLTTHLHLVPRSKNEWSYISTPQYVFTVWCLVKYRGNFTFTLTFTFMTEFEVTIQVVLQVPPYTLIFFQ